MSAGTARPRTAPGRLVDRVAGRAMRLPRATTDYAIAPVEIPMRDGVVLAGEHYAPARPCGGTVLVRGPYERRLPTSLVHGRLLAERGFHVVVQSCRGTWGSGDVFEPFAHEGDDGQDTVAWLREQPWFDGRLATYGPSYLGFTQWALLRDPPPELVAAVVLVGLHDLHAYTWGTGTLRLQDALSWSELVAGQERHGRLRAVARVTTAERRLRRGFVELPVVAAGERLLDGGAPWFREWVSRPDAADPYWEPRRATAALDRVQSPVLLVSGWQDVFLGQSLEQYARLRARGVDASLLVGAWRHTDPVSTGARIAVRETLRWLARHLATASARPSAPAPVQVELSGGGGWRRLAGWPPASTPLTLQLQPGGGLSADPPPPDAPASAFTFDPDAPTPSVGGPSLALSGGYRDDTELAGRPDVLAFTGGDLDRDLEIAGIVVVELAHRTDVPHADLFVRLCDTDARGRSRNVCEGYLRLPVERSQDAVRLELGAVAHRFAAGHRIRLLVAGGAHPVYARNLGTGEPVATGTRTVSVVHTVAHGPGGTSSVTLPVLSVAAA